MERIAVGIEYDGFAYAGWQAQAERATVQTIAERAFSAFRSSECQARSPIRRMERLTVERRGDWILIEATANAFLHHMMRNIAGLLIAIGKAEAPPSFAGEVLEGRDRTRNAATAPAAGLYLMSVRYGEAFALPAALALPAACPPEEPAPDRL